MTLPTPNDRVLTPHALETLSPDDVETVRAHDPLLAAMLDGLAAADVAAGTTWCVHSADDGTAYGITPADDPIDLATMTMIGMAVGGAFMRDVPAGTAWTVELDTTGVWFYRIDLDDEGVA